MQVKSEDRHELSMSETASHYHSVEHSTLCQLTTKLVSAITVDPLQVSTKLLERGVVSQELVESMLDKKRDNFEKATELVLQVTNKVQSLPTTFETFVGVLSEYLWMDDVVELLRQRYNENKEHEEKVCKAGIALLRIIGLSKPAGSIINGGDDAVICACPCLSVRRAIAMDACKEAKKALYNPPK